MSAWLDSTLALLALPTFGLGTVFVISFLSATFIPLGSEPVVIGLVKLNPAMLLPVIAVATLGNTLGGALTWWMGRGAERAYERASEGFKHHTKPDARALRWLRRWGPRACLLAWLPVVGDPLCALAGWLRLPFWACVAYMAVGKLARYVTMTLGVLSLWPG